MSRSRLGLSNDVEVLDQGETQGIGFVDDIEMGANLYEKLFHDQFGRFKTFLKFGNYDGLLNVKQASIFKINTVCW
jgi:hypothetical protein